MKILQIFGMHANFVRGYARNLWFLCMPKSSAFRASINFSSHNIIIISSAKIARYNLSNIAGTLFPAFKYLNFIGVPDFLFQSIIPISAETSL